MTDEQIIGDLVILDDMLKCNTACVDAGSFKTRKFLYEEDAIEWLYKNLPTLPYVISQIVSFIFSNGLTTGDEEQDKKLDDFLYAKNIKGATNYSVLQEGIKSALIYGKNGIRWLSEEDGIINIDSKHYASLTDENEEYYGFDDIIGYIVAMKGQKIWETDLDEIDFDKEMFIKKGVIIDKERKIIILSQEELLNLRNNTVKDNGESALAFDKQRLNLLTAVYERLNYDVEYDGPGRLLFQLKKGYAADTDNEVSTSEIVNQSSAAKDTRVAKAKKEAEGLGKQIKGSNSDNVIVTSDIFENFEHLPRVTKATEFFSYLENEGVIISQIFGVQPPLLGLGKISGNVSMEKIIDNAMLNDIVPIREKFATQISGFLADKIGVGKIYFDKYEMKQAIDDNDKRFKVVNMIEKLTRSGYTWLADKMADMLSDDLDAGEGQLKKLKTGAASIINKLKQLIGGSKENE